MSLVDSDSFSAQVKDEIPVGAWLHLRGGVSCCSREDERKLPWIRVN